jgi:hypothetical protein
MQQTIARMGRKTALEAPGRIAAWSQSWWQFKREKRNGIEEERQEDEGKEISADRRLSSDRKLGHPDYRKSGAV